MSALLDPITLEICWNRLIGVVNEQAAALQRTSFTSIVREAGDLSAGVFDSRGYMVAQAVTGTPDVPGRAGHGLGHHVAAAVEHARAHQLDGAGDEALPGRLSVGAPGPR
jgi:N-methylhydantoinase B/oxoprolinase/acetone carboxylase alpha subunit